MLEDLFNRVFRFLRSHKKPIPQDDSIKLQKKLSKKDDERSRKVNDLVDRKMQSMEDSQGVSDFSGSSYNGPGNVDHEKRNSNMSQRNF